MKSQKNRPSLLRTLGMIRAGYPVHQGIFAGIIAKLTGHTELAAKLEENFQLLTDSFVEAKADQAQLRKNSIREKRLQKQMKKEYRKVCEAIQQTMPPETWAEFGIGVERKKDE